jgi:hypothetical protein
MHQRFITRNVNDAAFETLISEYVCIAWISYLNAIHPKTVRVGNPDLALGRVECPEDAVKRAANQRNQFELPVLFYAVTAFALIVAGADTLMVVLAWLFVLTRLLHAAIHIGPNKVRWRSPVFALGLIILAVMWVKLFLHVATRGVVA